jgi:hypothetical protein
VRARLAVLLVATWGTASVARDHPLAGNLLRLGDGRVRFRVAADDPAAAADPRVDGATFSAHGDVAAGDGTASVQLPASG